MVEVTGWLGVKCVIVGSRARLDDEDAERRICRGETSCDNTTGGATCEQQKVIPRSVFRQWYRGRNAPPAITISNSCWDMKEAALEQARVGLVFMPRGAHAPSNVHSAEKPVSCYVHGDERQEKKQLRMTRVGESRAVKEFAITLTRGCLPIRARVVGTMIESRRSPLGTVSGERYGRRHSYTQRRRCCYSSKCG